LLAHRERGRLRHDEVGLDAGRARELERADAVDDAGGPAHADHKAAALGSVAVLGRHQRRITRVATILHAALGRRPPELRRRCRRYLMAVAVTPVLDPHAQALLDAMA